MNSSDAALAKKWKREGMCRKCGKVKTHTGFLMKKLVSGSRTFWFCSLIGKFCLKRRGARGGLKKILKCHDVALVDVAYSILSKDRQYYLSWHIYVSLYDFLILHPPKSWMNIRRRLINRCIKEYVFAVTP